MRVKSHWKSVSLFTGSGIVILFYLVALCADYITPYEYKQLSNKPLSPPTSIHFLDYEGKFHLRPFIYTIRLVDPLTQSYVEEKTQIYPLELFARGYKYKLLGIISTDRHLFGVMGRGESDLIPQVYLLGTDEIGRDRFSRLIHASKFTLLVAPLAVLCSGIIGLLLGCIAGYSLIGNWIDSLIMRVADSMIALPSLLLILFVRALFKPELSEMEAGILILLLFIILGWAETSLLTRNLVKNLKEREFVIAAVSLGLSNVAVLRRHILPNISPFLLAQLLLKLPAFMLLETSLSYLGVGIQEPEASWGTMLRTADDITLFHSGYSLLILSPAFAIMFFVFGVRLLSLGLTQIIDPFDYCKSVKS